MGNGRIVDREDLYSLLFKTPFYINVINEGIIL